MIGFGFFFFGALAEPDIALDGRSGLATIRTHFVNERQREDFFRPSSKLFRDFVSHDLVDRYQLAPPQHSAVRHVSYGPLHVSGQDKLDRAFYVESTGSDGSVTTHGAKAVVLAVGPSSRPNVPAVIKAASGSSPGGTDEIEGEAWSHSTAFARCDYDFLGRGAVREKLASGAPVRVVVIGGGSVPIPPSTVTSCLTSLLIVGSWLAQADVLADCRSGHL